MPKDVSKLDPAEVVAAYYALPLSQRGYKELAAHFGVPATKRNTNRFSIMVRDLEKRGLVHHEVLRDKTDFLPRNPQLEDDLRRRFALRQAVVVDTSSLGTASAALSQRPDQWARDDDEIHERLGTWAGRLLSSCLRSGDTIATGGGRGPYFAVLKTNVCAAHRYSGDIVPLTGQISARAWNRGESKGETPPYLDADNVASQLHGKLGTSGRLRSLNCPIIALPNPPETEDIDVAVFGIGALGAGHRLRDYEPLDDIKSVHTLLRDINTLAAAMERKAAHQGVPYYHPVGDVCNYYFLVEDGRFHPPAKEWLKLEGKIKELNAAFKSATPESLGRITKEGMVMAVAGGPHKAFTIRHVLRRSRERTWITHLVTDHATARWILAKEKDPAHGGTVKSPAANNAPNHGAPVGATKT